MMSVDGSGRTQRTQVICAWVEFSTARAYRDETGLYYRKCKQPAEPVKSFCREHQARFEFLMQRRKPASDASR